MKNLVFIKHENSNRLFLFSCRLDITLKEGDKVFCDTIYGLKFGVCATNSFMVEDTAVTEIVKGTGAYLPLKSIFGIAFEKVTYEPLPF